MRRIVSTTRECPCTSTVWPPRMKRAPCSAIACLALLEVSAKLRPLCTDKFCCQKHAVKHVGMPGPVGGRARAAHSVRKACEFQASAPQLLRG